MPKIPHMRFFVTDYLTDTPHLTTEEHGAYLLLLFHYWQTEKPLDNRKGRLATVVHLSPEKWEEVSKIVGEFFTIKRHIWTHGRVEFELSAVFARSTRATYAGKMSARKRANQRLLKSGSTEIEQTLNHKDKDIDKDSNRGKSSFDEFALVYPNLGNEKSARREFDKAIIRVPVGEVLKGALRYANDPNRDPLRTYLAANWLKDDRWKDPLLPMKAIKNGDVPFVPAPRPERIVEEVVELTEEQKAKIAEIQKGIREELASKKIEAKHKPTKGEGK